MMRDQREMSGMGSTASRAKLARTWNVPSCSASHRMWLGAQFIMSICSIKIHQKWCPSHSSEVKRCTAMLRSSSRVIEKSGKHRYILSRVLTSLEICGARYTLKTDHHVDCGNELT